MVRKPITYRELAMLFFRIGCRSFGGWSSTALQLEKELVHRRHILTAERIQGAVTYAQIVPGATQVAIVSHTAYRLKGSKGATLATICYLLPAIVLMLLFAACYFAFLWKNPDLPERIDGLVAALCGLILANAYKIGASHANRPWLWTLVALSGAAILFMHVHALLLIAGFGATGFILSLSKRKTRKAA